MVQTETDRVLSDPRKRDRSSPLRHQAIHNQTGQNTPALHYEVCVCVILYLYFFGGGGGGGLPWSWLPEQTPGLSRIHPHNLSISLDKTPRPADSQGCVECPECRKASAFLGEDIMHILPPWLLSSSLQSLSRSHREPLPKPVPGLRLLLRATPLIHNPYLPLSLGVGLIHREETCTNIRHFDLCMQSLTHTLTH